MRLNDHRWTRAVSDFTPQDVKRTTGRPPTRWSDFFTKSFKERYNAVRVPRTDRIHWTTLARERDKWKDCWRPLGTSEDQRESSFNTEFQHT
ncbi:hypothetical protein ANCDUO_00734 [Ancylostoma duodenale]|uniref:Uncharacterized protein n=1 Tax=Ancylostoma duodenale TaxID=51022 RepID=A0A0C2HBB4_9BILA|nr:hypothetical protein ANCDUO_00734 [Ancylostoma duodenale]